MSEKAIELLAAMSKLTEDGWQIMFEDDMGEGSMTVWLAKGGACNHTHIGLAGGSMEDLLAGLHDLFVNRRGLGFAIPLNDNDAGVAGTVDAAVSKTAAPEGREGSTPSARTNESNDQ